MCQVMYKFAIFSTLSILIVIILDIKYNRLGSINVYKIIANINVYFLSVYGTNKHELSTHGLMCLIQCQCY